MNKIPESAKQEAADVLRPMIDLFTGADGGVAFAKLHHYFLPEMLSQRGNSPEVDEFIKMIYQMSRLCELMKENQ